MSTCLYLSPTFPLAEAGGPLTGEGAGSPGFHRSPACALAPDAVAAGPGTLGNLMAAVPGFSEATSLSTGPERGRDVAEWGGEVLGCLDYSGGHEGGVSSSSFWLPGCRVPRSLGRREWGQLRPRLRRRKTPAEREPGAGLLQGTAGCRGRGGKAGSPAGLLCASPCLSSQSPWERGLVCLPARAVRVAFYKGETEARKGGEMSKAD